MKFSIEGEKTPITTIKICGKTVAEFYEGWSVNSVDCGDASCGKEVIELTITLKKLPWESDFYGKEYEAMVEEDDEFVKAIYKILGISSDL